MEEPMHLYELPYVIDGVLGEDEIADLVERVSAYITGNGGEIVEVDEWGMRRLAYPIKKRKSGYYVVVYFRAPGSLIAKLERAMKLNDRLLRYLTLRYDAKMERHYEKDVRRRAQAAAEAAEAPEAPEAEEPAEA